jgi:hypothetical protein
MLRVGRCLPAFPALRTLDTELWRDEVRTFI